MNRLMRRELMAPFQGAAKGIANTSLGRNYGEVVTPGAERAQDALVRLLGTDGAGSNTLRTNASRMAASPQVLNALKATPAIAGLYGTTVGLDAIDQIFNPEDESMAGTPMDLLGMGLGAGGAAYGINRGIGRLGGTTTAGGALGIAAAAGLGKMGSDALQGLIGI